MPSLSHLFVDISSHGFGHLAIAAPVLNALTERLPGLRITIRTALPAHKLRQRIQTDFTLIPEATDFGYVMRDALAIDREASAAAYRRAHADWPRRVEAEAEFLADLAADGVLSNVSYLPLAGAARAGIPAAALCSLNWADLFAHFFGAEDWAGPIHAEILAAYSSADVFLRTTPGMPMAALGNVVPVGPIAARGRPRDLGLGPGNRAVLVALGGIPHRLPIEEWPALPGVRWLVPAAWRCDHPAVLVAESLGLEFTDLLASVDAVVTKPGYGTFAEAACNGTPVIFQRREDWPEQDCLIDWLLGNGIAIEVSALQLQQGDLQAALAAIGARRLPLPRPGAAQAAGILARLLCGELAAGL